MIDSTSFLRDCLRLRHAPGELDEVRGAARSGDVDWDEVDALMRADRVGPLLYRAAGKRELLPAPCEDYVRRDFRVSTVRNRLLLRELSACLRAFSAAQLPVLVLKGAALAEAMYGEIGLRPMVDVDLLVQERDRARAERVLEGMGYAMSGREARAGALGAYECEIDFCKDGPIPMHVDVHWSLFDSPFYQQHLDMDWFWRTAEVISVAGEPARVLGGEAQLLHLCGHLALHHGGRGLLWWHDLFELIVTRGMRLDWRELLSRAQRYDLQLPLKATLLALADEWRAPVPHELLAALRGVQPSREEAWVYDRLRDGQPSAARRLWVDLASMQRWGDRWQFALTSLFPSPEYMQWRYHFTHRGLLPFYYAKRWLRGLRSVF